MAVTQDQHQIVLQQIADLRVHVETLAGKLDVTNERINNTNNVLNNLVDSLNEQAKQTRANRKWLILTTVGTLGTVATIVGVFLRVG
jgi:septal ring factor EnvC (AmiA/AmiB activator)